MSALSNPHDRYFKESFARTEVARDFLNAYLPPEVRAWLDISTMTLQKESFVDPDLRQHFSDMLYQVQTVAEEPTYVYLLFEHKSYPDQFTIFQMLRYCVRIWEQALRDDDSLARLPPILPLLVYHGEQPWRAPQDMVELLAGDEALHLYGPRFSCRLLDLSSWSVTRIRKSILRVVLQALQSVRDPRLGRDLLPGMLKLLIELTKEQGAIEYIQALLTYLSAASPHLTEEEVIDALDQATVDKGGKTIMPTLAEKWYEQGVEQGIEQGIAKGVEQGIAKGVEWGERLGAARTLLDQLSYRFGPLDPLLEEQIRALSMSQIHTLSLFTLDASSIDQVAAQVERLRNE